jgi:hypothetical protein
MRLLLWRNSGIQPRANNIAAHGRLAEMLKDIRAAAHRRTFHTLAGLASRFGGMLFEHEATSDVRLNDFVEAAITQVSRYL